MSDTRRYAEPGWGPNHPDWFWPNIVSQKQLENRNPPNSRRKHQFCRWGKNSRHNLLLKIDKLRERESLGEL